MRLRGHFENIAPSLKTVVSRWRRGIYARAVRSMEPPINDVRGPVVRTIEKMRTSPREEQIDQMVVLYEGGMSMNKIAAKYRMHRRTVAAHLERRGVSLRSPRSLPAEYVAEAVRIYESGVPLLEVGRRFGVSQHAARYAIASTGATIRPKGHIPKGSLSNAA